MNLTTKKARKKAPIKDDFSVDDKVLDICGIVDGSVEVQGTLIRTFDLNSPMESVELPTVSPLLNNTNSSDLNKNISSTIFENKNQILDHSSIKANLSGRTPPIDGEIFDMVRSYTLRRSTSRILSKIKAIHSDDNVYLNTIIDEAIRYYYEYLKNFNI